jgi:hypothetical protein
MVEHKYEYVKALEKNDICFSITMSNSKMQNKL